MPKKSTLTELLEAAWDENPEGDPQTIALTAVHGARTRKDLLGLVLNTLTHQAKLVRRGRTRRIEEEVFSPRLWPSDSHTGNAEADPPLNMAEVRRRFVHEHFTLSPGVSVSWLQATVEEHQERIDYLERLQAGIGTTVGRHRKAQKYINEAEVECLGDLPDLPDDFFNDEA